MAERQFGETVAEILNDGLRLDAHAARRLRTARERALSSRRLKHIPAHACADKVVRRFDGLSHRLLAPIAALVIGLVIVHACQQNQRVAEVGEIDALSPTDDLPIDVYLDARSANWPKKSAGEQP